MRLRALRIGGLRCIAAARMEIGGDLVVLEGPNGAGKTSVLEAIHLLGHGRSFRARGMEGLVRRGSQGLTVAAVVERAGGLQRGSWTWADGVGEARIEGVRRAQAELLALFRVLTQHPGSHALVQGPREERRRFLDWLMFHVEPAFLGVWRDFRRALRQRNAAIPQRRGRSRSGRVGTEHRQRRGIDRGLEADGGRAASGGFRRNRSPSALRSRASRADRGGWPARRPTLGGGSYAAPGSGSATGSDRVGSASRGFELRCGELLGEQLSRGQAKLAALALLPRGGEGLGEEGRRNAGPLAR